MPSPERLLILFLVVINAVVLKSGFTEDAGWYQLLFITIPMLVIALIAGFENKLPGSGKSNASGSTSQIKNKIVQKSFTRMEQSVPSPH
jgi:hypothetical protein